MDETIKKLKEENEELLKKIMSLSKTLEELDGISGLQVLLMKQQLNVMKEYSHILDRRTRDLYRKKEGK